MDTRNVVFVTESEWNATYRPKATRWAVANADTVLAKVSGDSFLYKIVKSRHSDNVGKFVNMEIL